MKLILFFLRPEAWDLLFQSLRQHAEQRQLEALALPCLDRKHNPQEQHGQRSQNSKQKKSHGGSDIRKEECGDGQNEKDSPKQNALPGVKADKAVVAKCRQKQDHRGRGQSEISDGRGRPFRGRKRCHRPSATGTEFRVRGHHSSAMGTLHGSLRRIRGAFLGKFVGTLPGTFLDTILGTILWTRQFGVHSFSSGTVRKRHKSGKCGGW